MKLGFVTENIDRFSRFWLRPIDARPLALVRIATALACLINWATLWEDRANLFYTGGTYEAGVVAEGWSIFAIATSYGAIDTVLLITLWAIAMMGLGLATPLALGWCFLFSYSYLPKIPLSYGGWEYLLHIMTFLLLVSPCGRMWSLDRRIALHFAQKRGWQLPGATVPRYPLLLLRWQFIVLFVSTFWQKTAHHPWRSGIEAGHFLLSRYSSIQTTWLLHHPTLNVLLTHLTLVIELIVPFLLLKRQTRRVGFVLLVGLMGVIATSKVYPYAWTILALSLAFLDGEDLRESRFNPSSVADPHSRHPSE